MKKSKNLCLVIEERLAPNFESGQVALLLFHNSYFKFNREVIV